MLRHAHPVRILNAKSLLFTMPGLCSVYREQTNENVKHVNKAIKWCSSAITHLTQELEGGVGGGFYNALEEVAGAHVDRGWVHLKSGNDHNNRRATADVLAALGHVKDFPAAKELEQAVLKKNKKDEKERFDNRKCESNHAYTIHEPHMNHICRKPLIHHSLLPSSQIL